MTSLLADYQRYSRRRRRAAAQKGTRLDIQGLRMVAVLTVFANHLWGWPSGGFVGVDVFFVISGFLITGNLLRTAETRGNVSFGRFYWNRVRRIVPAATVVLLLTFGAALLLFQTFRAEQVGVDAFWVFVFLSNWWFAVQGTDYFQAAEQTVSPLQHYWSLSIEEQFYFVWPALIFVIGLLVLRRSWSHFHRMAIAAAVMGVIVAASLGWALYQTAVAPTWAYFDTFARVWELGVGALLAIGVGVLSRLPNAVRPVLSWGGLGLIAASLLLISDGSAGFPAPWALLPVIGAALVIAAGVGGEPAYQQFLRNPVSGYVGDISYSLYLVHWPVIVLLAALMEPGPYYWGAVLALAFGLAIASYHFVENPLRKASWTNLPHIEITPATRFAAVGATTLLTASLLVYAVQPRETPDSLIATQAQAAESGAPGPPLTPLAGALQEEITAALQATEWPALDPSMESVINESGVPDEIRQCSSVAVPDPAACTWGSPTAPTRVVLVGDSIAMTYAEPLRSLALNGAMQLHIETMVGCQFSSELIFNPDDGVQAACADRKQRAVDYINVNRPNVVIIADSYGQKRLADTQQAMTSGDWGDGMRDIVGQFRGNVEQVVWMSAPPADINIGECYGTRSSSPAECISRVTDQWHSIADIEQDVAQDLGGVWIDSRPWLCSDGLCPAFVGTTPVKRDQAHLSSAYAERITPIINESLIDAGVL